LHPIELSQRVPARSENCFLFNVSGKFIMSSKHNAASRLLAASALVTLGLATIAEAQPYGPGQGGGNMMDGSWGWGMGYGMGGFGGISVLVLALAVLAIAAVAMRRRSS